MPSIYAANDPGVYELMMGRWSRRLAGPFLDFAAIGAIGRVLDVGCGTGRLTSALAGFAPGAEIVGVRAPAAAGEEPSGAEPPPEDEE